MPGPNIGRMEQFWVDHYAFLERRGYRLRPRYDPVHLPIRERVKWYQSSPSYPEDEITTLRPAVLDAVRTVDGLTVVLRKATTWSDEVPILQRLNDLHSDPRNRTVPILDTILLPDSDEHVLLVIPLLHSYYDPPFTSPAQVVQALLQLLEAMQFLHENDVAHRDFCTNNLMLDPSELFPEGFHVARPYLSRDGQTLGVNFRNRPDVSPVRYFVIDFGLATHLPYRSGWVTTGVFGADKTVPELSWETPYDPFKVDIYQFGRVIMCDMIEVYNGLEFLRPLAEEMTRKDPDRRPDVTTSLALLREIAMHLPAAELQRDIWPVNHTIMLGFTSRPRRSCCG